MAFKEPMPFIGTILALPRIRDGWLRCDGALLPVDDVYGVLFSLIGTAYGGDGVTAFALPDLRGRVPVGAGGGPGLPPVALGEMGGAVGAVMRPSQLPAHKHLGSVALAASTASASLTSPANASPAVTLMDDGRTQIASYAPVTAAN